MRWYPEKMLLHDVYGQFGGLEQAGLKRIGKKHNELLLTFFDGTEMTIQPRGIIPLPYMPYGTDCRVEGGCD